MSLGDSKKQSLKLTTISTGSQILLKLAAVPISIFVAKTLGPALLGALAIFKLIAQYAGYNHFGTLQAMIRQIPIVLAKKDEKEARDIQNIVFSFNAFVTLLTIGIVWALYLSGCSFDGVLNFHRMIILTLILAFRRVDAYLHNYVKAMGQFSLLTYRQVIVNWSSPFLMIILVLIWKLEGAMVAGLITSLLGILIYLLKCKIRWPDWYLPIKKILEFISLGIKLFANRIADGIFWTIDITVIAFFLSPKDVGYYGFALGIVGSATIFVSMFTMMLYRHMLQDRARQKGKLNFDFMKQYLDNPMSGLLLVSTLYLVSAIFGATLIVELFLPKYREVIACLPILGVGQIFFLAAMIPSICMNVGDKLELRLVFTVIGLCLNAVLDIFLIKAGFGIVGAAWASTISFGIYAASIIIWIRHQVYGNILEPIVFITKLVCMSLVVFYMVLFFQNKVLLSFITSLGGNLGLTLKIIDVGLKTILIWGAALVGYFTLFHKQKLFEECLEAAKYLIFSTFKKVRLSS